jgi:hypothetical protein
VIAVDRRLGDRFRELDDLVLDLKGLVLVRSLRERSGADDSEILMYSAEIDRVRSQLARLVRMAAA